MKDDSLSDVAFCNTKEGMHIKAKELGVSAYNLGCHCDECNKHFAEMIKAYGIPSIEDVQYYKCKCINASIDPKVIWRCSECGGEIIAHKLDPWIVGKDDYWFIYNDKRLHKESWNAALVAASKELLKTYPYSAKEQKILQEQIK
jgi:hypothetical protein